MIFYKGSNTIRKWPALLLLPFLLASCFLPPKVKRYPRNQPFVYNNKFEVKGDSLSSAQKADLKSRVAAQLDDSMVVKVLDRAILQGLIKSPPAFDTLSLNQSVQNIKVLMNNLGYFRAEVNASYKIDSTRKSQYRVISTFTVNTKKNTLIDSLSYRLPTADLQQLTNDGMKNALLKKGEPYTVEKVSGERNRLISTFRNNGYFKVTPDDIYALVDTINKALLNPNLSDFERILLLNQLKNKRPTINVQVLTRPTGDSLKFRRYYIGDITVIPDFNFSGIAFDSLSSKMSKDSTITIRYRRDKYHTSLITNNIFLKKNNLYRDEDYLVTLNNLNQLGPWQVVNITATDTVNSNGLPVINFLITLTPVKRLSFSANLESSYSTNVAAATGNGNIVGFLGNVSLTDRNVAKEGARMTHTVRGGIEFNLSQRGIQNSRELGYSNSFVTPKLIRLVPFLPRKNKILLSRSSSINTNISSLNRVGFFNLASFSIGASYYWKTKPTISKSWKPLYIEYSNLFNESQSFKEARDTNVFLRNSFQTSLVMGMSAGYLYEIPGKKPNRSSSVKINIEESGLLFGTVKKAVNNDAFLKNLREYIKADAEYKHLISYKKSAWAFRVFAGAGTPIRGDSGLPFFKQYFAGGPNSMRAWPIRTLGQGGGKFPVYSPGANRFNDRVGDVQLEANIEYRYNIAQLITNVMALKGALFMDAGNVWAIKRDKTIANGEDDPKVFNFKNLYRQLAVGLGTGFRLDFNYFILRFDFGFRFKKPDVAENNGWQIPSINIKNVFGRNGREWRYNNFNFTFGINYAF